MGSKIYRIIRVKNKKKPPNYTLPTPLHIHAYILHNTIFSIVQYFRSKYPLQYRYMQISLGILSTPPQFQFRSTFFFIQFSRSFWFRGVDGSFPDSKINCVDTRIAFVTSNCPPIRHCILITRYYTSSWTNDIYICVYSRKIDHETSCSRFRINVHWFRIISRTQVCVIICLIVIEYGICIYGYFVI